MLPMLMCASGLACRRVGDPFSSGVDQGPQVDADQFNKILSYIDKGQKEGE